ncbi:hypothetical protein [Lentzea sp.]|uniref:hypothetical protein n=1 Tax=Lentzea sp. TaxID=56099 RepID=UPI002C2919FE|nr:hypothetical protein [Lentzea sp.]HUQ56419.1 hypothetical protein [Lentzea sp.]
MLEGGDARPRAGLCTVRYQSSDMVAEAAGLFAALGVPHAPVDLPVDGEVGQV